MQLDRMVSDKNRTEAIVSEPPNTCERNSLIFDAVVVGAQRPNRIESKREKRMTIDGDFAFANPQFDNESQAL